MAPLTKILRKIKITAFAIYGLKVRFHSFFGKIFDQMRNSCRAGKNSIFKLDTLIECNHKNIYTRTKYRTLLTFFYHFYRTCNRFIEIRG